MHISDTFSFHPLVLSLLHHVLMGRIQSTSDFMWEFEFLCLLNLFSVYTDTHTSLHVQCDNGLKASLSPPIFFSPHKKDWEHFTSHKVLALACLELATHREHFSSQTLPVPDLASSGTRQAACLVRREVLVGPLQWKFSQEELERHKPLKPCVFSVVHPI